MPITHARVVLIMPFGHRANGPLPLKPCGFACDTATRVRPRHKAPTEVSTEVCCSIRRDAGEEAEHRDQADEGIQRAI